MDDLVARTHSWGESKQQFTRRQIELAADVLARKGWIHNLN